MFCSLQQIYVSQLSMSVRSIASATHIKCQVLEINYRENNWRFTTPFKVDRLDDAKKKNNENMLKEQVVAPVCVGNIIKCKEVRK